jgi:hypothetical protein
VIDFGKACPISRPSARKYTKFYQYIASEVLRGESVSTSSDVFFRGLIMYNIGNTLKSDTIKSLGKQYKHNKSSAQPSIPIFSKILEKAVYNWLMNYININGVLFRNQFGFRKNHSTSHALINLNDQISTGFGANKHTVGIFLDLSLAFDTVTE